MEGYHDIHSYPAAEHLPGLVIYRFDGPLFFANATTFRDEIRRLANAEPKPSLDPDRRGARDRRGHHRVRRAGGTRRGAERPGISLVFAELKDPVRRKIERYGLTRTIDPHHFFPTIDAAIAAFRDETGARWTAAAASRPTAREPPRPGRPAMARPPAIPAVPPR